MHPRNIYNIPPNFKELAILYPEFRKHVKQELSGRLTIDYKDQNAVRELTCSLLKKDFNLDVEISQARLIPRIPLCLNYILWVEDLLNALNKSSPPFGIDIGTGSSCIYSLLAAKKGWKMLATELDPVNFKCAESNVLKNNLEELISLKLINDSDQLLLGVIDKQTNYDFCMCNPPFFDYNEEPKNRTFKRPKVETIASQVSSEISTKGGELAFVTKLIQESLQLRDQVKIYTTLVGKKSDFLLLKKELKKISPNSFEFTEFHQGRTVRWGLAWSFSDLNFTSQVKSAWSNHKKQKLKPPLSLLLTSDGKGIDIWFNKIKEVLTELKIRFNEEIINTGFIIHFKAFENTWSHQRKKKRIMARAGSHIKNNEYVTQSICTELFKNEGTKLHSEKINKTTLTEGLLLLKNKQNLIVIEISWTSGSKESLYQIFQYIKNHFNK